MPIIDTKTLTDFTAAIFERSAIPPAVARQVADSLVQGNLKGHDSHGVIRIETYVPQTKFFRQFADAGTDVFSFSTNLGTGFSAPTWLGPDQWDFKTLDELAHRVLEANPRGLLLPRIYL